MTRHELGLVDYGPTPTAVNADAQIVAVRSAADVIDAISYLDADEREELLRSLGIDDSTPLGDSDDEEDEDDLDEVDEEEDEDLDEEDNAEDDENATSDDSELGAEDPPTKALRSASDLARRIRVEQIRRGIA